jgi:DNA primase
MARNLALAFDADSAGEEAMLRCVDYENTMDAEIRVIVLPAGKDPDEVIKEDSAAWQSLVEKAMPALDFTFDMVTAGLDMTTPTNKTLVTGKLLPILAKLKDTLRQDHYLNRLASLTGISYKRLENALGQQYARTVSRPQTTRTGAKSAALFSNPLEEDCLTLLLRHPELKTHDCGLLAEHFENSAHREIFAAWQQCEDTTSLRDNLDAALFDYLDALIKVDKPVLATRVEERYNAYVLRLQEEHLRSLERKRAAVFALEAQERGSGADLSKLEQDGIEVSAGLRDLFTRRASASPYRQQKRN